jgi:hypothetical protein
MKNSYSVILIDDEESCSIKQVSRNAFDQINNMIVKGEDDLHIVNSIVDLNTTEDNLLTNGLKKDEAIQYAENATDEYVILKVF